MEKVNKGKLETAARLILEAIGEDVGREGLKERKSGAGGGKPSEDEKMKET